MDHLECENVIKTTPEILTPPTPVKTAGIYSGRLRNNSEHSERLARDKDNCNNERDNKKITKANKKKKTINTSQSSDLRHFSFTPINMTEQTYPHQLVMEGETSAKQTVQSGDSLSTVPLQTTEKNINTLPEKITSTHLTIPANMEAISSSEKAITQDEEEIKKLKE